jgi:hypothetical protein
MRSMLFSKKIQLFIYACNCFFAKRKRVIFTCRVQIIIKLSQLPVFALLFCLVEFPLGITAILWNLIWLVHYKWKGQKLFGLMTIAISDNRPNCTRMFRGYINKGCSDMQNERIAVQVLKRWTKDVAFQSYKQAGRKDVVWVAQTSYKS